MKDWPGVPLVWAVAPFRAHAFVGVLGVFQGQGGSVTRRGLVCQDWWCRVGVMRTVQGIPLFFAVASVRDQCF